MRVLHIIDSLDYRGAARQLHLIGPAQASGGTAVEIGCLGAETAWSASLRQAGIPVHVLGWTRWLDLAALWRLRDLLNRAAPDVIHVWGLPALRTLAVVARRMLPRVVLAARLPHIDKLPWWDRLLVRQVRCQDLPFAKRCQDPFQEKGPDTFSIVCVGSLERASGFRDAIWAFDILVQLYTNAQLLIAGAGAQESDLRALAHGLQNDGNVQFLGARADAGEVLRRADVVWIPSRADGGRQVALEAMALGKAVVAADVPCLREVIDDRETGFLVPAGDVVSLARRTHALLQDEWLRGRIGETARRCVEERFSLAQAVERWREVYGSVAAMNP